MLIPTESKWAFLFWTLGHWPLPSGHNYPNSCSFRRLWRWGGFGASRPKGIRAFPIDYSCSPPLVHWCSHPTVDDNEVTPSRFRWVLQRKLCPIVNRQGSRLRWCWPYFDFLPFSHIMFQCKNYFSSTQNFSMHWKECVLMTRTERVKLILFQLMDHNIHSVNLLINFG